MHAPLRRGHTTVHEKWDLNTGILSGDAMLIWLINTSKTISPRFLGNWQNFLVKRHKFVEGQQWDVDFETRDDVTILEYQK
jgi:geranylgeranyl diphosphate synthase type II